MPESDNDGNALAADASQVLGVSVQLAGTVASGRNSRVYRVRTTTGEMLAVKRFFRTRSTTRDYLQAEYAALRFLWNHGERRVPRPISVDEPTRLLISEFVAGEPVPTASVSDADIDEAVDFLASLRALTRNPDSADLPDASEACFTLQAIVDNIGARRLRLQREGDFGVLDGALRCFLDEFDLTVPDAVHACTAMAEELPLARRTLSPSDFGFHNSLRRSDGRIAFIDFEHFGWDDPAKMIADVVLHPAMGLPAGLADRFVGGMLESLDDDGTMAARLQATEPLFGLKWCTILLNEFIAPDLARRSFAEGDKLDRSTLLREQIVKAQNMLHHVQAALRRLPHRN